VKSITKELQLIAEKNNGWRKIYSEEDNALKVLNAITEIVLETLQEVEKSRPHIAKEEN
jgi:hypothetical protein